MSVNKLTLKEIGKRMFDYAEQTQILAWVALCQTGVEHGAGGGVQQETNHTHMYETRQSRWIEIG